jgi:hypothetical protein
VEYVHTFRGPSVVRDSGWVRWPDGLTQVLLAKALVQAQERVAGVQMVRYRKNQSNPNSHSPIKNAILRIC